MLILNSNKSYCQSNGRILSFSFFTHFLKLFFILFGLFSTHISELEISIQFCAFEAHVDVL
jgi:hypothetical protein